MNPITFIYAIIRNILWNEDNGTHNELKILTSSLVTLLRHNLQHNPHHLVRIIIFHRKKAEPWLCFFTLILRTRRLLSREGRGL